MVAWAISRANPLGLHRMVLRIQNAAHNLLVLQAILEVGCYATFGETPLMRTCCCLFYDYSIGCVVGLRAYTRQGERAYPEITPKFC